MRKFFLLTTFFTLTPFVLFASLLLLTFTFSSHNPTYSFGAPSYTSVAFAALPTMQSIEIGEITTTDSRVELVRQFFAKYQSPLEPYAQHIVAAADQYGLDFRLLPAIAMQESNLCNKAPEGSNNCWGWGIYGGKITKFESYAYAIDIVTKSLAKEYKNKGLETPEEIVQKYTPSDNGKWSFAVNHFMEQLR